MPRFAVFVLTAVLASPAQAQRYTVQTVALGNYQEALDTAQALRDLAYDAYVDFAMFEGRQYARVRVGCFVDQGSAAAMAALLKASVTAEAVVAEASPNAPVGLCLRREMGFALPQGWDVLRSSPSAVAYRVEVMGQRGYMVFGSLGWQLAQSEEEALGSIPDAGPVLASARPASFQALTREGRPFVAVASPGAAFIIANGQLLWQNPTSAVVLEGDAVVAYHLEESP